ncbi:ARID DNA-binding domain-containing protein [Tanacetum coccineum]
MPSPNSHSSKWPKVHRSTYGLPNIWYQSKDWGPMKREQKLEFVQRQLKRENQEQIGSCMKKISEDCKDMLKDKMKEVMQFNSSLNNPISNNRYKHYRCFQCKELGHIVKYCPMDKKKIGKRRMEGIEASKPSVMITYPETIHFSTSTMIKDTDLTTWDEIWYVSDKLDRHVCYKLDAFCNIKENFCVTNLENQKKFLFSYGIGEVLTEQGSNKLIIPGVHYTPEVTLNILSLELLEKQGFDVGYDGNRCTLFPMFKNKKIHHFDEDKMRKMQNKYLQDYFESIANKDGMGQDTLEILTSYLKTARAPLKAHTCAPLEPAWKAEIDREGLGTHQWKTGEHGENLTRSVVPKGKEVLEHLGVQLEDTTKYPSEPTQVHYMEKQQKFYTVPSSSKVKEEYASSTSSGDFTVIT